MSLTRQINPTRPQPSNDPARRLRLTATGALAGAAAIFLGTHLPDNPGTGILLIRAMAEAGMIGGLADWFAVEALFRRPLGLPIPHTALLPRNQSRAAENLGRFIEDRFLQETQLRDAIMQAQPAQRLLDWVDQPGTARLLGGFLSTMALRATQGQPSPRFLVRMRRWLRSMAQSSDADAALAGLMAEFAREGARSGLVDDVLDQLRAGLEADRELSIRLVRDNSRWWISSRVDRRVAGLALDAALNVIETLRQPDSDLRQDLDAALTRLIERMEADGTLERFAEAGRRRAIKAGALDRLVAMIATSVQQRMREQITAQPQQTAETLGDLAHDILRGVLVSPADRAAFDTAIAEAIAQSASALGPEIRRYVGDVINSWAPEELVAYIEQEVGRDLQFIRINGTVLGALIGGLIFSVSALLG